MQFCAEHIPHDHKAHLMKREGNIYPTATTTNPFLTCHGGKQGYL